MPSKREGVRKAREGAGDGKKSQELMGETWKRELVRMKRGEGEGEEKDHVKEGVGGKRKTKE